MDVSTIHGWGFSTFGIGLKLSLGGANRRAQMVKWELCSNNANGSKPTATANNNSNKRTAAITNSNVNTTIFGNTITEL